MDYTTNQLYTMADEQTYYDLMPSLIPLDEDDYFDMPSLIPLYKEETLEQLKIRVTDYLDDMQTTCYIALENKHFDFIPIWLKFAQNLDYNDYQQMSYGQKLAILDKRDFGLRDDEDFDDVDFSLI